MLPSCKLNLSLASSQVKLCDMINSQSTSTMEDLISIYSRLKEINPDLELELEIRFKILPPKNFKSYKIQEITYLRSTIYPSVTFRRYKGDMHIYTKELIDKRREGDIVYALSIEKTNTHFSLKTPLIETGIRIQERMLVSKMPLAEIIKNGSEYTLEIEYSSNDDIEKIYDLISQYKCEYYPTKKPMEISVNQLTKKLMDYPDVWYLSFKADGIHVLVLDDIILYDNGLITDFNGNTALPNPNPRNVYEAEMMDDNKLLYFDCIMHDYELVTHLHLSKRLEFIDRDKCWVKEYIPLNKNNIRSLIYYVPNFKSDGFIITDSFRTYKSKFINTVDLRYRNGYLYLENEDLSERIPNTKFDYEEDKVYEFNMNMELVKERRDKTIANFKFPYEDNPLFKIAFGIGVPSLRVINNRIKMHLLSTLKEDNMSNVLLDIGSGKGGDMLKWIDIGFDMVYAVDPNIDFRMHNNKIIEIKEKIEDLPSFVKFDYVSILFVPWNTYFTNVIEKSRKSIIAIMDNPINFECLQFKCKVQDIDGRKHVHLEIPDSETATSIDEFVYTIDEIIPNNFVYEKVELNMIPIIDEEIILANFYSYYIIKKVDVR